MNGRHLWLVERDGIIEALVSIAVFLSRIDGLAAYSHQFNELASIFEDLQRGTVHPITKPAKRNSRSVERTDILCAQARVAIAIALLRKAGMTVDEAAKLAAKKHPTLKRLIPRQNHRSAPLWAAIANWHDKFVAKRVKNEEAQQLYDDLVRTDVFGIANKSSEEITALAHRHLTVTSDFIPILN